jgi:hypothetical protein
MSITVTYYRLSARERASLTRDQSSWEPFRLRIQRAHIQSFQSAIAGLEGFSGSQEERFIKLEALLQESRDPRRFDMEKDWHLVGYLLTGRTEIVEEHRPDDILYSVVFGGRQTSATTGYGAVRYFDEQLVAQAADALRAADRESIGQRFDPAKMMQLDIYAPPVGGEREAVLSVVDDFTAFFREAASAGEEVVKFAT